MKSYTATFLLAAFFLAFQTNAQESVQSSLLPSVLKGKWATPDGVYSQGIEISQNGNEYFLTHWSNRSNCTLRKIPVSVSQIDAVFKIEVIDKNLIRCGTFYVLEIKSNGASFAGVMKTDISSSYSEYIVKFSP